MSVRVEGQKVPLYGAGATLAALDNSGGVPLKLEFEVRSRGDVVGRLVKTKHQRYISCSLIIDSKTTRLIRFKKKSCSYD